MAALISNTNSHIEKLTNSLHKITRALGESKSNMKETEEHFDQILLTMKETKTQNRKIETELISLVKVVNEIGRAFEEVAISADDLTSITNDLN